MIVAVAAGVLGLLVGSFLNVVAHRVPLEASVVSPPSACPGCGVPIRPRDNIPVVSWLLLRGRCRDCKAPISWRYPAVELGTALLFATTAAVVGWSWALPAYLYLAALCIVLSVIDIDVHRLPDEIVKPSWGVIAVLLVVATVGSGSLDDAIRALAGAAILGGIYFLIVLLYPAGMGWGDVKLAPILGAALAWSGWAELAVGGFAGFFLGGVVGTALMAVGRAGRKTRIPFGPFMLAGAQVGLFVGDPLARWYLDLLL